MRTTYISLVLLFCICQTASSQSSSDLHRPVKGEIISDPLNVGDGDSRQYKDPRQPPSWLVPASFGPPGLPRVKPPPPPAMLPPPYYDEVMLYHNTRAPYWVYAPNYVHYYQGDRMYHPPPAPSTPYELYNAHLNNHLNQQFQAYMGNNYHVLLQQQNYYCQYYRC